MTFKKDRIGTTLNIGKALPEDEPQISDLFAQMIGEMDYMPEQDRKEALVTHTGKKMAAVIQNPETYVLIRSRDHTGVTGFAFSTFYTAAEIDAWEWEDTAPSLLLLWFTTRADRRGVMTDGKTLETHLLDGLKANLNARHPRIEALSELRNKYMQAAMKANGFTKIVQYSSAEDDSIYQRWQYNRPLVN